MLHVTPTAATAVPVTHSDHLPPEIADAVLAEALGEAVTFQTWEQTVAEYEVATAECERVRRIYSAAEEAVIAFRKSGVPLEPPAPAALVVEGEGLSMTYRGKTTDIPPESYTYKSHDAVTKATTLTSEQKIAMHAALEVHAAATAKHQHEIGYAPLVAAEAAAEAQWHAASDSSYGAFSRLRDFPVTTFQGLAKKTAFLTAPSPDYEPDELSFTAIAADVQRLAAPRPPKGTNFIARSWAEQVQAVEAAFAAQHAEGGEGACADETIDATNDALGALGRMVAPDFEAVLRKFEEHLPFRDGRLCTNDDRLHKMLDSGDSNAIELATLFLDIERLCRVSGIPTTFMPRATSRRLAFFGCEVKPDGFSFPDGCSGEVLQFIRELTPGQVTTLMAAAWIDALLKAGGELQRLGGAPRFSYDLVPGSTADAEACAKLIGMMPVGHDQGADHRLRLAVMKQAAEELAARRLDRWSTKVAAELELELAA